MRKFLFLLVGMLFLFATGCQHQSYGSLQMYTVLDSLSGDTLLGVTAKNQTIVPAARYTSFWADKNMIICERRSVGADVFFRNGEPFGVKTYLEFDKYAFGKNVVYIGQNTDSAYCYFPTIGVIGGREIFASDENVFIQQDEMWYVYNPEGQRVWSFPISAQFVKDMETEKILVAVSKQKRYKICENGSVYTPDGKIYHKYNVYRWRKFRKQLIHPVMLHRIPFFEVNFSII